MTNKVIYPLRDRVVVKVDENPEKTEGGLFLPDVLIDPKVNRPVTGVVVAVGQGITRSNGVFVPNTVKVGDKVLFNKNAGTDASEIEKGLKIFPESEILCTVENEV